MVLWLVLDFFFLVIQPFRKQCKGIFILCTPNFNSTCTQKYSQSRKMVNLLYIWCSIVGRRQRRHTPVLLPGKSHGWRSLVGCSPWGREESSMTERFHFHFSLSCIGEEMATHSSVLAWRIPGTGEPSGLPSMGLHRVGHDWSDLAVAAVLLTYNLSLPPFNTETQCDN